MSNDQIGYATAGQNNPAQDDFAGSLSTHAYATVNARFSGAIETAGDRDWLGVYLIAGHNYQIDLNGEGRGTVPALADTVIRGVYDETGARLVASFDDDGGLGKDSQITLTPETTGMYFIDANGFANHVGGYSLLVQDLSVADDYTYDRHGYISPDVPRLGHVSYAHDVDYFDVYLEVGKAYSLSLSSASLTGGQNLRPEIIGLTSSNGASIPIDALLHNSETVSDISDLSVRESGLYTLAVTGQGRSIGAYDVSLTAVGDVGNDEFADVPNDARKLSLSQPLFSRIDHAQDIDFVPADLIAGHKYVFLLERAGTDWPLGDPVINGVYFQDGTMIEHSHNDDFLGLTAVAKWLSIKPAPILWLHLGSGITRAIIVLQWSILACRMILKATRQQRGIWRFMLL